MGKGAEHGEWLDSLEKRVSALEGWHTEPPDEFRFISARVDITAQTTIGATATLVAVSSHESRSVFDIYATDTGNTWRESDDTGRPEAYTEHGYPISLPTGSYSWKVTLHPSDPLLGPPVSEVVPFEIPTGVFPPIPPPLPDPPPTMPDPGDAGRLWKYVHPYDIDFGRGAGTPFVGDFPEPAFWIDPRDGSEANSGLETSPLLSIGEAVARGAQTVIYKYSSRPYESVHGQSGQWVIDYGRPITIMAEPGYEQVVNVSHSGGNSMKSPNVLAGIRFVYTGAQPPVLEDGVTIDPRSWHGAGTVFYKTSGEVLACTAENFPGAGFSTVEDDGVISALNLSIGCCGYHPGQASGSGTWTSKSKRSLFYAPAAVGNRSVTKWWYQPDVGPGRWIYTDSNGHIEDYWDGFGVNLTQYLIAIGNYGRGYHVYNSTGDVACRGAYLEANGLHAKFGEPYWGAAEISTMSFDGRESGRVEVSNNLVRPGTWIPASAQTGVFVGGVDHGNVAEIGNVWLPPTAQAPTLNQALETLDDLPTDGATGPLDPMTRKFRRPFRDIRAEWSEPA